MKHFLYLPTRVLFLLCLIMYSISIFTQSNPKDSLWATWNDTELENNTRFKAMHELVYQNFLFTDPDSAYVLANNALESASKPENLYWMVRFSSLMGISLAIRGKTTEALEIFLKSLEWSRALGDPADIGTNLGYLGNIYFNIGNYKEAIQYHMEGIKIFEQVEDMDNAVVSLSAIGNIYGEMEDYENALIKYEKALELSKQIENKSRPAVIYQNMGSIMEKSNDLKQALKYYQNSLDIKEKENYNTGIPRSLASIGNIHIKLKNYEEGLKYLNRALNSSQELGNRKAECTALIYLGDLYSKKGDTSGALKIGQKAYDIALELNDQSYIKDASKFLYERYKDLNKKDKALQYYEQFITLRDSINSEANNRELIRQQYQYDYEKKEALAKLEQEKKDAVTALQIKRQKMIRNTSLGGFGLMCIAAFVFLSQRNKIKKEKAVSEKLLLNILPYEVAEELKAKGSTDAKLFDQVTVLFTDFKNFTKIAEKLSPAQLVNEIDICFKAFDQIMEKHNIEKIKTIGDAYMAAGGLPVPNSANPIDVVSAALEIRDFMLDHNKQYLLENREVFEIRIGVHSGPVVAGIVGIKKFQYDIWGDTVNSASRMESSGEAGKVNISGVTYEFVKDHFDCTYRGKISAKNKGELDMYFVNEKKRSLE